MQWHWLQAVAILWMLLIGTWGALRYVESKPLGATMIISAFAGFFGILYAHDQIFVMP